MTKLPKDQDLNSDNWVDDILDQVEVTAIPIEYLESVQITFVDGEIWDLTIDKQFHSDIEVYLAEILEDHEEEVEDVSFRLNAVKVKKDMTKLTKRFMKRKK